MSTPDTHAGTQPTDGPPGGPTEPTLEKAGSPALDDSAVLPAGEAGETVLDDAVPERPVAPVAAADAPDEASGAASDDGAGPDAPEDSNLLQLAADRLESIERQLAESHRLIDRQTEISAALHAENQALRKGELRAAQQGLVVSVLRVCDDLDHALAAMVEDDGARRDLEIVRAVLLDALAHNGVETMPVEADETFDARRHRAARVVRTAEQSRDRAIVTVLRPGFQWADGPIVRVAEVEVLKFSPAAAPPPEPAQTTAAADGTPTDPS